MNSQNYLSLSLLIVLLTASSGCGFMGTEVGNGVKDDRKKPENAGVETKSGKDKANKGDAADESPILVSAGEDDTDNKDEMVNDTAASGESMSGAMSQSAGQDKSGAKMPASAIVTDVLMSTCGSLFSLPIASPLSLSVIEPSGTSTVVSATYASPKWSLLVNRQPVADITPELATMDLYDVTVSAREGVPSAASYVCSEISVANNVTVPSLASPVDQVKVNIRTPNLSYDVTWYLAPGSNQQALPSLQRYEIRVVETGSLIILAAPAE